MISKKRTAMSGAKSNELLVSLGREIGETKECAKHIGEKLDKFMSNDHVHLCADVKALDSRLTAEVAKLTDAMSKMATRLAYIWGIISAVAIATQVIIKVMSK